MKYLTRLPMQMLAQCRRILYALVVSSAAVTAAQSGVALAQGSTDGSVTVTPAIAVVDTARRIVIRGNWHNACLPSTAEIVADSNPTPAQLTIRLNEIFTFAACAQVITPYTFEISYTPRNVGGLPIVVLTTGGQKVAEGRISTVSKDDGAATVNLTGAWFEAPTAKSLLMISHSQSNPDALVATWSVFDADGKSRALLFHSSLRTATANVYHAPLYSLSASATTSCPSFGCPVAGFAGLQVGWVRVEVRSSREIKIEAWMHGFPADVLAFSSVMTRYEF